MTRVLCKNIGNEIKKYGNWRDLSYYKLDKVSEGNITLTEHGIKYSKGAIFRVNLGVAMELPNGYEAHIIPRSSTRKYYGVMLTNSQGLIDVEYNGDTDYWLAEFYAIQDGEMNYGDRVVQFSINKTKEFGLDFAETLNNSNRGGFGTSGK